MARDRHYKPGDNWIIDDITGFKVRASEARTQWDGTVVHERIYAPRHPQDFVRGKADRQAAALVRPEPIDEFIGPMAVETTAAASPGDLYVRVTVSTGMRIGDQISIMLADGMTFRTSIATLFPIGFLLAENGDYLTTEAGEFLLWEDQSDGSGVIGLSDVLPDAVAAGARVFNNSAMANATLP